MQMASRKVIAGLMVLALCITTLSSAGSDVEAKAKASLKTKKISVKVGKKKSILIKNKTKKHSYSFTSSNKQVAKVTSKGKVTGIKAGKATITVKEVLKKGKKKKGKKKKRTLGKVKVTVTGMGMVMRPITEPGVYSSGIPLQPNKVWRKTAALVMNIDDMSKRLKAIERKVNQQD